MLPVSTQDQGAIADNCRIRTFGGSGANEHPRKKARKSQEKTSNSSRVNLRVDVNASLLSSFRRVPNVRRSQIANVGEVLISDDSETSDGGNLTTEEPFVIARKLLRRRHVRKEQLRKEREARELQNLRDSAPNRRSNGTNSGQSGRGSRHPTGTRRAKIESVADHAASSLRPQLSPMLFRTDSLSNVTQESPAKSKSSDSGATNLEIEGKSSPTRGKIASVEISVTPEPAAPVPALIAIPRAINFQPTRVPVSPLYSRNRM